MPMHTNDTCAVNFSGVGSVRARKRTNLCQIAEAEAAVPHVGWCLGYKCSTDSRNSRRFTMPCVRRITHVALACAVLGRKANCKYSEFSGYNVVG